MTSSIPQDENAPPIHPLPRIRPHPLKQRYAAAFMSRKVKWELVWQMWKKYSRVQVDQLGGDGGIGRPVVEDKESCGI